MKKINNLSVIFAFALLFAAVSSSARAGDITWTQGTSGGGDTLFEFTLDTTGMVGGFDTFELVLTPTAGTFNQVGDAGTAVTQASEDSGFIDFLTAPVNFGGQALSAFGIVDTTAEVSGTHASLGSNDASELGNYLVAQIVMSQGGMGVYRAEFFDDGDSVGSAEGPFGIPEPSTLALAGLSLIGVITSRRRKS